MNLRITSAQSGPANPIHGRALHGVGGLAASVSASRPETLLVLANSYKQGGRCIAGKRLLRQASGVWQVGEWVRPVQAHGFGCGDAMPAHGFGCTPLNTLSLGLSPLATPVTGQPENLCWNPDLPVTRHGRIQRRALPDLAALLDHPDSLWADPLAIRDDEVTPGYAAPLSASLYLIRPPRFQLHLWVTPEGRRKIALDLTYRGRDYRGLAVTDPALFQQLRREFPAPGAAPARLEPTVAGHHLLTISLSQPFGHRQCRYKLAAAVIDPDTLNQE